MHLGERLKELRKERHWSQAELAERIGADARQISRYENGRITPSAEVIVKLAQTFNVSIDYLLLDEASRSPLRIEDQELLKRLEALQTLSDIDRSSLFHIIDALIAKNQIKGEIETLARSLS